MQPAMAMISRPTLSAASVVVEKDVRTGLAAIRPAMTALLDLERRQNAEIGRRAERPRRAQ
jgi:hypothetical protein